MVIILQTEAIRYIRLKNADTKALDEKYQEKRRVDMPHKVVISLTTLPVRINKIQQTINSLLDQTVKVDEIVMNLPYVSLKGDAYVIPDWLENLDNVTLRRIDEDRGRATKLLPTLEVEDPNTRIIVVDDDIVYNSKTVENLITAFERYEGKAVISNYGLNIDEKLSIPFSAMSRLPLFFLPTGTRVDLLQGFSSYVVTRKLFPPEVFDTAAGNPESKYVDDVWFSGWLGHNGVKIFQLKTWAQMPLPVFDEAVNSETLGKTCPSGFIYETKTIEWFIANTNFRPLFMQNMENK